MSDTTPNPVWTAEEEARCQARLHQHVAALPRRRSPGLSWLAWLLVDVGIFLVGILVGVLVVGTICEGADLAWWAEQRAGERDRTPRPRTSPDCSEPDEPCFHNDPFVTEFNFYGAIGTLAPSNLSISGGALALGSPQWIKAMRDAKICILALLADGSGMRATLATTDQGCAGPTQESQVVGWETMYRVMKGEAHRLARREEIPFPDCPYDAPPGEIPYVCIWKPSTRSTP